MNILVVIYWVVVIAVGVLLVWAILHTDFSK